MTFLTRGGCISIHAGDVSTNRVRPCARESDQLNGWCLTAGAEQEDDLQNTAGRCAQEPGVKKPVRPLLTEIANVHRYPKHGREKDFGAGGQVGEKNAAELIRGGAPPSWIAKESATNAKDMSEGSSWTESRACGQVCHFCSYERGGAQHAERSQSQPAENMPTTRSNTQDKYTKTYQTMRNMKAKTPHTQPRLAEKSPKSNSAKLLYSDVILSPHARKRREARVLLHNAYANVGLITIRACRCCTVNMGMCITSHTHKYPNK